MLDNNKHIDNLFNDKLRDFSIQPNPKVWNEIENKLNNRKKKRFLIIISTTIAASITLLFGIGLNILTPNNKFEANNSITQQEYTIDTKKTIESSSIKKDTKTVEPTNLSQSLKLTVHEKSSVENKNITNISSEKDFSQITLKSIDSGKISNTNQLFTDLIISPIDQEINRADEIQIAKNIALLEEQKQNSPVKKWSITGLIASNYSNEKSNRDETGKYSFGGGVKVNCKIGKKISLQAGVMYNKIGQNIASKSGGVMASEKGTSNRQYTLASSTIPYSTSAGKVRLKGNPMLSSLHFTESKGNINSTDFDQQFETIEIPLLLRYHILNQKFGLSISGGINTNLLVSNALYKNNKKVGEIEDLRTTNFSSQIGIGINYKINSKLHIDIEPSFKYYLNSLSKDSNFDYKPYSIGFATGITYNF